MINDNFDVVFESADIPDWAMIGVVVEGSDISIKQKLEKQLNKYVEAEDYRNAAVIHKKLKEINNGNKSKIK